MSARIDSRFAATAQDRANAAVYHSAGVVDQYTIRGLDAAESVALLKYAAAYFGKSVLDIGVGTGRTTRVLRRVASRYVGIDYSAAMVQYMHEKDSEAEVHLADMRDLSPWQDGSFDFVFGSNNVIDAVGHEDRLQVLREVRRVLKPGGVLAFSSHNRAASADVAPDRPTLQRFRNPLTQWIHWRRYRRQNHNYRKLEPYFTASAEYSLRPDTGHDYSCLHYYIDPLAQRKQLEQLGYTVTDVIDRAGESLAP
jgi:SAM-dependent methyltransferase